MLDSYPVVLDVKDVQQIMRIGRDAAYKKMKSGEFKSIKIGSHYRVSKTVFAKYLEQAE